MTTRASLGAAGKTAEERSVVPGAHPHTESSPTSCARGGLVVVGIDDSECARRAARWAADEASLRGGALHLVRAFTVPASGAGDLTALLRRLSADQVLLSEMVAALRADHPALEISSQHSHGDTATVLRQTSANAALTVVGVHGHHRLAVALGSVAAGMSAANPAPVAVVPLGEPRVGGPVVVGVDDSASDAALAFAFQAAALRGAPLVAVHCWSDPAIDAPFPAYSALMMQDPQSVVDAHRKLFAERMVGWNVRYPTVGVRQVLVHGRPTATLLEYAKTAQLVVVGTRGHGRLAAFCWARRAIPSSPTLPAPS